ncbi:hypothetical protein P692DRAFT_201812167 [Suillus brevipes Sb2]|nr:hypothetical protein P692DRAFT_201812167 [Suillus brevipes Sb2]
MARLGECPTGRWSVKTTLASEDTPSPKVADTSTSTSTVFFSEKVEEVCTSCTQCHEKKTKCMHPSPQQEEALCAAVALKKSKAAAKKTQATSKRKPSAGQSKSRSTPGPGEDEESWWDVLKSVEKIKENAPADHRGTGQDVRRTGDLERRTRRRPTPITPEIVEDDEQDAEGEVDPEITAASDADQMPKAGIEGGAEVGVEGEVGAGVEGVAMGGVEGVAAGGVEAGVEGPVAETPLDFDAGGGPIVDNNVDMDPLVLDQRPSPVAANRVEAVETKVDTLEAAWAMKFALMETKMQEMSTTTMKNTVSLGHIANKLNTFTRTGNVTAFNPSADISVGSLYGQLPASWLPRVTNASNVGGSSISSMGRALTTAWDESQAPVQMAPGTSSISAVPVADEASSEEPCEPSGSVSTAME